MTAALIEQLVARGLNSLFEGVLIAGSAWVLVRVIGSRNSATRFAMWFSALLAIVALFTFDRSGLIGTHSRMAEFMVPARWALYLFIGWAAFALLGLARVGAGLWRLQRIRRNSEPMDNSILQRFNLSMVPLMRRATLLMSDEVRVPAAIGFFRPAVLLPRWTLDELSPDELNTVLLHELAHLRRWDDWTNLAQKVIRALLFFHPAVWWVDSRLAIEREMSCDDMVLAHSDNPHKYATCLVAVAERSFLRRPVALAQAAVAHVKHTALRITKILDGKQRRVTSAWKPALGALTSFLVLSAAIVEHTPQLVGFAETPQIASNSSAGGELGGRVVPAVARVQPSRNDFVKHAPRHVVTPAFRRKRSPAPDGERVIARATLPAGSAVIETFRGRANDGVPPQVVRARMKQNASPAFMLVVFQTQESDEDGSVVVRTYVWRIRVPAQARAEVGMDPRTT